MPLGPHRTSRFLIACLAIAALPLFAATRTQDPDAGATPANRPADSPEGGAVAFDRAFRALFEPLLTWHEPNVDPALARRVAQMAPAGDAARSARAFAAGCLDWQWLEAQASPARIEAARQAAGRAGDLDAMLYLDSCLAAWLHRNGRTRHALEKVNASLLATQRRGAPLHQQLHVLMTRLAYTSLLGDQASTLIDLDRAQVLYEQAHPQWPVERFDLDRAIAYRRMGAYPEASAAQQRYQRLQARGGSGQLDSRFREEVAYLQQESGHPAAALATSAQMIERAGRDADNNARSSALKIRAEALVALHRHAEALQAIADFDALPAASRPQVFIGLTRTAQAQALAGLGRHREALAALDRAQALLGDLGIQRYLAVIHGARAASQEALGRHAAALASYRKHVELRDDQQQRMELQRITFERMRVEIEAGARENQLLKSQASLQQHRMEALLQARRWQFGSLAAGAVLLALIAWLLWRQWQRSQQLHALATTDPLTGVANRSSMMERMQAAIDAGPPPFSLLLADIDRFKAINDLHGHPVGDLVLQEFARCCDGLLNSGQLFGRWGGEEFIVFCRGDLDAAARLAERIRTGIEALGIDAGPDEPLALTVSIGATTLRADEPDVRAAITRADAALYRAKRDGRNRVVVDA